jgi:Protein of unknown function (DUF4242)
MTSGIRQQQSGNLLTTQNVAFIRLPFHWNPFEGTRKSNLEARQMPKYVIEREIPDAGKSSAEDLRAAAQKSCGVIRNLGTDIRWVHSYVTDDKVYCVFIARDEQLIREHAKQGGIPANRISEVRTIIDPATAEA